MIKNTGLILSELLISSIIIIMLIASALGVLIVTKAICTNSITAYTLQRNVDAVMDKIVRGSKEAGAIYGLRSAVSFSPMPLPVNGTNTITFTGTDNNARSYALSGNSITYTTPALSPHLRTIYTAPANATTTLRFKQVGAGAETIEVYIAVKQTVSKKTMTGSLVTYVTLKNTH